MTGWYPVSTSHRHLGTQRRQASCNHRRVSASISSLCLILLLPWPAPRPTRRCKPHGRPASASKARRWMYSMYCTSLIRLLLCPPYVCMASHAHSRTKEDPHEESLRAWLADLHDNRPTQAARAKAEIYQSLTPRCLPHYPIFLCQTLSLLGSSSICLLLDKGQASPTLSVTIASPALT